MVAEGVELQSIVSDQQEGRVGSAITDGLAQVGQGIAEVGQRIAVGPFGPQEAGQCGAGVWAVRFHGQVGQQGSDLVRLEPRDRLAIQRGLKSSE